MNKTLMEDVFDIMPKNMADYSNEHQKKLKELLKLDNDDIPISQVKFAPRRIPKFN